MLIRNGKDESNEVRYEGTVAGEAICIGLSEDDPAANTRWLLRIYVQTPQGEFQLGAVTTNTAAVDGAPSRIVAFASCPGAIGWVVRAQNNFPSGNNASNAQLWVVPGKCCGAMPGIPGVIPPPQPPGGGAGFSLPIPPS